MCCAPLYVAAVDNRLRAVRNSSWKDCDLDATDADADHCFANRSSGAACAAPPIDAGPETGFFSPEYVNVFGAPFAFPPHEGGGDGPLPPPKPKTAIELDPAKAEFAISWPNAVRVDRRWRSFPALDWESLLCRADKNFRFLKNDGIKKRRG